MYTTIAFMQSVDPGGLWVTLNGVADQHVRVVGADIQVPTLNQIVAVAGMVENVAAFDMRLTSPSLRERGLFRIVPLNVATAVAVEPGSPQAVVDLRATPIELVTTEQLNVEINTNPAAVQLQSAVVCLADKPIVPVTGKMFTIEATGATALVAGTWTNVALTFTEDLPRGRYALVGIFPISAGMIAARAVFVGGGWRPGVLGSDVASDLQHPMFRYGGMGVMGEFEDIEPPTMDCLAISGDATQEFYLDLIQLRKGPG